MEWSESTDVGDFIRDAARATEFMIHISPLPPPPSTTTGSPDQDGEVAEEEAVITVEVPTFADRTRFLRRKLQIVEGELKEMEGLKIMCDRLAHKGARRMALTGFGILVVYWGAVARLTFWDYGWYVFHTFCTLFRSILFVRDQTLILLFFRCTDPVGTLWSRSHTSRDCQPSYVAISGTTALLPPFLTPSSALLTS